MLVGKDDVIDLTLAAVLCEGYLLIEDVSGIGKTTLARALAVRLVDRGIQDGYRVGIISNACLSISDHPFHTQPGRSPQQLATLLSALEGITPVVVAPFERLLLRGSG